MYVRIRNLREDSDLSQKQIADYLGCSQVAYSYYEIGKRSLPLDLLCKLADFYNCSGKLDKNMIILDDLIKPYDFAFITLSK